MLAHVCGVSVGVARYIDPVVVRRPSDRKVPVLRSTFEGFKKIIADIEKTKKRAVVSLSWELGYDLTQTADPKIKQTNDMIGKAFADAFGKLDKLGATIVTGSGNSGKVSQRHYWI